jgi:hypothetical protein
VILNQVGRFIGVFSCFGKLRNFWRTFVVNFVSCFAASTRMASSDKSASAWTAASPSALSFSEIFLPIPGMIAMSSSRKNSPFLQWWMTQYVVVPF